MGSAAVQFPTNCLSSSSLLDPSLVPSGLRSLFGKLQINLIVFWWMQFELLEMNNSSSGSSLKSKAGSAIPSDGSFKRKRGVFQKDLQHMMYGFGDDNNPLPETVTLVEDIVVEYITDLVHKAQDIATKRGKLLTEDFLYLMRKDYPKLHRSTELLSMHEELKQARKAFELDEEKIVTAD